MAPGAAKSIRDLARQLRLSPTTVSEALRGKARVARATTARVQTAAREAGYTSNLLAGRVMSELRRGKAQRFRGTLAILDVEEGPRPPGASDYNRELVHGAAARADSLGFSLDRLALGPGGLPPSRLNRVLVARSISGVLVLPVFAEAHLESLDWSKLTGVYLDRVIRHPRLHSVSADHYGGMCDALHTLAARGYRRPGLVVRFQQDSRLQRRWEGAFLATCEQAPDLDPTPILVADSIDERTFASWFARHRPDVVLAHGTTFLTWIRNAGARPPESHGFVSLNTVGCTEPCAAIDLQPCVIGARGVELLVGQILQGEFGPPPVPCNTSVPTRWQDGPTICPPATDLADTAWAGTMQ